MLVASPASQRVPAAAARAQLAGATVLDRSGQDAEPDSVWLFEPQLWVAFEVKSGCKPDGEVSASNARDASGHVNYAVDSTGASAPPGSFAVIISPQERVHRAAAAVAGDRVYLVPPPAISDIADRLTGAWESIRIQTRAMEAAEAKSVIAEIMSTRRALPSQWLPGLARRRLTPPRRWMTAGVDSARAA